MSMETFEQFVERMEKVERRDLLQEALGTKATSGRYTNTKARLAITKPSTLWQKVISKIEAFPNM